MHHKVLQIWSFFLESTVFCDKQEGVKMFKVIREYFFVLVCVHLVSLGLALSIQGYAQSATPKATESQKSEMITKHKKMAEMHSKMASCLESDRPMSECRKEMSEMSGESTCTDCPMTGKGCSCEKCKSKGCSCAMCEGRGGSCEMCKDKGMMGEESCGCKAPEKSGKGPGGSQQKGTKTKEGN
jgi:hypothetical protein